jgi:hypothetical protein
LAFTPRRQALAAPRIPRSPASCCWAPACCTPIPSGCRAIESTRPRDRPVDINIYSPYTAGYSGRVIRVRANGRKETVADNLPSMTDNSGASYGPTDVAFIGQTLYVLIEMGGCWHALPDDLPAILRVNRNGSTTNVANLNAWHAANPPNFIKDTNPVTTDQEPGGVFHSMIAIGKYLYVVETNRGFPLRVDPRTGVIEQLYDLSIDNREHNPIVMTRQDNKFFVGTFGEDQGRSELAVFDRHFSAYSLPFKSRNLDRRAGVASPRSLCRRNLSVRQSMVHRHGQSRRVRSQERQAHRGADRIREPPERSHRGPGRCAVHIELGYFVRARRWRGATHRTVRSVLPRASRPAYDASRSLQDPHGGDLAVEVNSPGVIQYLNAKLESWSGRLKVSATQVDQDMIGELQRFGIASLADLERRISASLLEHWASQLTPQTYIGMLRDVMMYDDIDHYFDKAWMKAWTGWDTASFDLLSRKYGPAKTEAIMHRYGLELDYEQRMAEPDSETG